MSLPSNKAYPKLDNMVAADIPRVAAIEASAQLTPWSQSLFQQCLTADYLCQVLRQTPDIISGFQILSLILDEAHLLNIAVAPEWQRQGLGRLMLTHAIDTAKAQDASVLLLEVRASNDKAINLYTSFGFTHYHTRRGYYRTSDGHEDALLMQCLL